MSNLYKINDLYFDPEQKRSEFSCYIDKVAIEVITNIIDYTDALKTLYFNTDRGKQSMYINELGGIRKNGKHFFVGNFEIENKKEIIQLEPSDFDEDKLIKDYIDYQYDERMFFTLMLIINRTKQNPNVELENTILKHIKTYEFDEMNSDFTQPIEEVKVININKSNDISINKTERGKFFIKSPDKDLHFLISILNILSENHFYYDLYLYLLSNQSNGFPVYINGENHELHSIVKNKDNVEITTTIFDDSHTETKNRFDEKLFLTIWYLLANSYGENKEFNKIMDKYGELLPYEEVK